MKDYLEKQSKGYNKIFLLHLPKCAGTYTDWLLSGDKEKNRYQKGGNWIGRKHSFFVSNASYLTKQGWKEFKNLGPGWDKKWEGSKIINDEFVFTIVRNPFDMLASYYFHTHHNSKITDGWSHSNLIHKFKNFKDFIVSYCDPNYKIPNTNISWHVPLLKDFLYTQMFDMHGNCKVHFIIKYEYLDEGLKLISNRFNLPFSSKSSMKEKTLTADRTKRNSSIIKLKNYKDYYDNEMIDLVAKKCKNELAISGYDFNGTTNDKKYLDFSKIYYNPLTKEFKR